MTGPERYARALQLIEQAHTSQHDNGPGCGSEELLAEAAAQASLAAAAATIDAARIAVLLAGEARHAGTTMRSIMGQWDRATSGMGVTGG